MARQKRKWYEGAVYHVMGRGNRRTVIYKEKEDYYVFLQILANVRKKRLFTLHAYCLMTNHFHLELTTAKDPIWMIMKPLMNSYAKYFNQKYGFEGHLFDSRYTSGLIEDEIYFLEVSRYIHLNPVKAKMVREPQAYEYSSYQVYIRESEQNCSHGNGPDNVQTDNLVDTSRILQCFHHGSREQYRMFVEGKISHAEQEMLIQKDMKEDDLWLPW